MWELRSCSSRVSHCLDDGQHPVLLLVALDLGQLPLAGHGNAPLAVLWSEGEKHCPSVEEQWDIHRGQGLPKPLIEAG